MSILIQLEFFAGVLMRGVSLLALLLSAVSLAGCAGGDGGAGTLANNLEVCGLGCTGGGGGGGDPVVDDDADDDGTPDDDDTDGSTGSGAGGNGTNLSTGLKTIVLKASVYDRPTSGTALATLASGDAATLATTTAAILSASKPIKLKYSADTNSGSNGELAVPIYMDQYLPGTNATDPFNVGANANGGSGTRYREYRALSNEANRDELLQVWSWDHSFATQYRNSAGGGDAKHQAWSFGGNATAAMPLGGTGNYQGRFVATAKTENWLKPTGSDINPDALWRVQGESNIAANFGTGVVTGSLKPETWTSFQSGVSAYHTWRTSTFSGVGAPSVATVANPEFSFYESQVNIAAKVDGTNVAKNTYTGTAKLDGNFVSGDNPVYGGFYGAGANETTGIFNVYGIDPSPIGGSAGINGDTRGYLTINGAFNGTCQSGTCTP